jgi:hypothetical protein
MSTPSGGKLAKNNTYSTATLKPQSNFEGWATKQGGSHKSWKKRYFLLVPAVNNTNGGAELYYFKSESAKSAIGVIKLSASTIVKELPLKGKSCIAIENGFVGNRTYVMHCQSPSEQDKFLKALNDKIQDLKKKPDPKPNSNPTPSPTPGPTPIQTQPNPDGIKFALDSAKNAISFLGGGDGEDRILEFWQIWNDSIPVNGTDVSVTLVMTADMSQLSWRVYGPQNILIQEMVDFFWNVGAPEQEIDRLNDVGGLINPLTIGSWIDMSTKGGMDGGWVFPVNVPMTDALKACDEGVPLTKLAEWTKSHGIVECITVGRDMGASPPRQTEIRFSVKGNAFEDKLNTAMNAYAEFGFPSLSEQYLEALRQWHPTSIDLSVITSSEGFVRIGMILPDPDKNIVQQLCQLNSSSYQSLSQFQQKMKIDKPAFVEFQYLNESYGYGVYNEGLNLVFHYALDPHMV